MGSRSKFNKEQNVGEADDDEDEEEKRKDLIFPGEMSIQSKFQSLVHIRKGLERKIAERDEIIRDLVIQVERRDRILELSSVCGDLVEVVKMGGDSEGRSFYEIRNKEKIPFMIKTERLSPTPMQINWEKLNESESFEDETLVKTVVDCPEKTEQKANHVQVQEEKDEEWMEPSLQVNQDFDEILSDDLDDLDLDVDLEEGELEEEEVEEKVPSKIITKEECSTVQLRQKSKPKTITKPKTRFSRSRSPSLERSSHHNGNRTKKRPQNPENKIESRIPEKKPKRERKRSPWPLMTSAKLPEKSSSSGRSSLRSSKERDPSHISGLPQSNSPRPSRSSRSSRSLRSSKSSGSSRSSFQNGLKLEVRSKADQIFSHCFAFTDDLNSTFSKFWESGSPKSEVMKYQVKLHGGQSGWESQSFTMIEQSDLDPEDKTQIILNRKLKEIHRKIESYFPDENKRIWLELRDFPQILSKSFKSHFDLNRIGRFITHLTLSPGVLSSHRQQKIKSNLLLSFISQNLPSLQFSALNSDALDFSDENLPVQKSPSQNVWKNLKVFKFVRSTVRPEISGPLTEIPFKSTGSSFPPKFFRRIWRRSPNLQRLYEAPLEILGEIGIVSKSGSIVRSICFASARFQLTSGQDYHEQLKFAQSCCNHLEELDTRTFFIHPLATKLRAAVIRTLSQILEKNAETLKKIKVEPDRPPNWLKFPVFKNLTTLSFCLNAESSDLVSPFFGGGTNVTDFTKTFPNLKNVEICNASTVKELHLLVFEKCFPLEVFPPHCFQRVEYLFLKNFGGSDTITHITRMFSNVKHLRLKHRLVEVNKILPTMFKCLKKLEQLQLEVDTDGCLDSGLTGIDPGDLKKLRNDPKFGTFKGQYRIFRRAEKLRTKRSILALTNLSLLRIVLYPGRNLNQFSTKNPILSPASAFFGLGFKLSRSGITTPQLKVQIAFGETMRLVEKEIILDSLKPMLPYVILES